MVNLKLFALLMCKGNLKLKTEILFDIILGPEKMLNGDKNINWQSNKALGIFKQFFFFSEVFPKKY